MENVLSVLETKGAGLILSSGSSSPEHIICLSLLSPCIGYGEIKRRAFSQPLRFNPYPATMDLDDALD